MFDLSPTEQFAELTRLRGVIEASGTAPGRRHDHGALPAPAALERLLPRGLPRAAITGLDSDRYLAAALIGAAVANDGVAAVIGVPDLGMEAVAAAGAPIHQLVRFDAPGAAWLDALDTFIGTVDVILVDPPAPVGDALAKRIAARLRRGTGRTALLAGSALPAPLRLAVSNTRCVGLAAGRGQFDRRLATVTAHRASDTAEPDHVRLLLPGPGGLPQPLAPVESAPARRHLRLVNGSGHQAA